MIKENIYSTEELEEKLQEIFWRQSERRKLSAEEEKMEWFIHCKNEVAGDDNPDVLDFNVKNLIFNITKKTIGYDLSIDSDYSYINRISKGTSLNDALLSIEPMHLTGDISSGNTVSCYLEVTSIPLMMTNPEKMYTLSTI